MSNVRARIARLVAAHAARNAELAARPPLTGVARAARVAAMVAVAEQGGPDTPRNRRCHRVAALMRMAEDRQNLAP